MAKALLMSGRVPMRNGWYLTLLGRCAMSSGDSNVFEGLFKLWASICKMILDGARKAEEVAKYLQRVNDDPNFLEKLDHPAQASVNTDIPTDGWATEWTRFYQQVFGITVDLSKVSIPDDPGGFGLVVFVIKEMIYNRVWAKCSDLLKVSSWYGDDFDSLIDKEKEERKADNGPYAVRFRNRIEADEENKNLSANKLTKRGGEHITLLEQLLLSLFIWWRTKGFHLDMHSWTLCAGSRGSAGSVPCVSWYSDQLQVSFYHPGNANDNIRSRSAV